MKKLLTLALMAVATISFATPADDAKKVAESIYAKKDTFVDTVLQTRQNYAKWRDSQKLDVKLGDWYVSQYIKKHRKNAIAHANPIKNGVNLKDVFGREPLWRKFDIRDGEMFPLTKTNFRKLDSSILFITREIEADKEQDFSFTFGLECYFEIYLNDTLIGKSVVWWREAPKVSIYTGKLKKGKNRLTFKITSTARMSGEWLYFTPYADPVSVISENLKKDFKNETNTAINTRYYYMQFYPYLIPADFITSKNNAESFDDMLQGMVEHSHFSQGEFYKRYQALKADKSASATEERIKLFADIYTTTVVECELGFDVKNVRAAMEDIKNSYPQEYDADGKLFAELKKWEAQMPALKKSLYEGVSRSKCDTSKAREFKNWATKALLANPLLKKYPQWVMIKRDGKSHVAGLPNNWQGNATLACKPWTSNSLRDPKICATYKDELYTFDITKPNQNKLLFKPAKNNLLIDLDISFDGEKILYSTLDDKMYFRLDELDTKTGKTKTLTPSINKDVDYFDGIYLPDGQILFLSTACWVGVPCVGGIDSVANIYVMDPNAGDEKEVDKTIRQLTFEQDADWMPVLMENGRVMYTRWEYVDNSHYFSRILMHMNPDGTAQSSLYGSTSYWPNSLFYARQIPGDPNKFVGIVSGHHGEARCGELHLFDISKGTQEEAGRVHKYPSYNREYIAETKDELVRGKNPQILYPYPLSEKYIVASVRNPSMRQHRWEVCLMDKFDNIIPLQSFGTEAHAFEPMPLMPRAKPTEIADKTNPELDYGYVFLNDIYQGGGLKDVPRGTVKSLRILEYHYAYRDTGSHDIIANEGSWDVKRIHGTVPVLEDGSALFKVPANRPLALQPLDKDGKALALMRTWFTVMPGETQSCVGCHEGQGMSPTSKPAMASRKPPSKIKPFVAGVRGYSFIRDVQPVLDKYCAGCHNGTGKKPNFKRGVKDAKGFPKAYLDLAKYVRRSGPECNQNMLIPMEFNVDTSELMHLLKKGHKGVKLDDESMKILITWMDLNVPCYGTWKEVTKIPHNGDAMRKKYLAKYANRHDDQEAITYDGGVQKFVKPAPSKKHPQTEVKVEGFPFDSKTASEKVADVKGEGNNAIKRLFGIKSSLPKEIEADINGEKVRFVLVPAGSYVMGSNKGYYDEGPATITCVEKPFYMSQFEITNKQYAKFDASHNSGFHDRQYKDHVNRGYPANEPNMPVVRVNWNSAQAFCKWMSEKVGVDVVLPTEKQWEWAARGGTAGDFWFGKLGENYGTFENMSDFSVSNFAVVGVDSQPCVDETPLNSYVPRDNFANDGQLLGCEVGQYKPNPFGLYDMLGNVSEWTADDYTETLGGKKVEDKKAVRGGSWRDRAKRSRVSFRRDYHPWQKVYNVGLRLVINDVEAAAKKFAKAQPLPEYVERNITVPVNTVPQN